MTAREEEVPASGEGGEEPPPPDGLAEEGLGKER